ncbi:MAG: ped2 [Deltaproteobacteria bacterium]|nr:ped2 [Deltaproteobacteria bacterium]
MKLKGRVAIITGGARGLGKAFALRLAEEGARIAVADILDASAVKDEIVSKGGEALAIYTDVSEEESVGSMVRVVSEQFGRVDILVNDAPLRVVKGRYHRVDARYGARSRRRQYLRQCRRSRAHDHRSC